LAPKEVEVEREREREREILLLAPKEVEVERDTSFGAKKGRSREREKHFN
jgi:hypothetical protein